MSTDRLSFPGDRHIPTFKPPLCAPYTVTPERVSRLFLLVANSKEREASGFSRNSETQFEGKAMILAHTELI
jgi:hypothetical protein